MRAPVQHWIWILLAAPPLLAQRPAGVDRPARPAYHIYDQRATVVDMDSMLKQQSEEPEATPKPDSQELRQALRDDFRRDKQFGLSRVESIDVLPSIQDPIPLEEEPEEPWLTPGDLADEADLQIQEAEGADLDLQPEEMDVDPIVEWGDLSESMMAGELEEDADGDNPDSDPAADALEDDGEDAAGSSLVRGGLNLQPAITSVAPLIQDDAGGESADVTGGQDIRPDPILESSLSIDRLPFQSPEAQALVDAMSRDEFSRTRSSMQEIAGRWERTADPVGTLSSPVSTAAGVNPWSPTSSVNLPRSAPDFAPVRTPDLDLSRNSAVRSIRPLEVDLPRMDPLPTVQDPMNRKVLNPPGRTPPLERNTFRRDDYRIRSGMGDGFPVGPFR